MTVLKPLGHEALFVLLVQCAVLLGVARILGELMRRWNQPQVVGELAAGVLLGPSFLGLLAPGLRTALFPAEQHQADLLSVVGWLGVLLLILVTGLETDLDLIVRRGRTALAISAGGIAIPFATGLWLGHVLPESFLADPSKRLVFSLFMAVAMSISAVPVLAKVLLDLNLIRRDIGQISLAAAMTDDLIGWILLAMVAGLAASGVMDGLTVMKSVGSAVVFLGVAFTVGRPAMAALLRWVDDAFGGASAQTSAILAMALGAGALTHWLGIEAVLGAFVVGILAGGAPRMKRETEHGLALTTSSFLAPIFFASAGLKVDLPALFEPRVAVAGVAVLAVACLGKFVGCYLGAMLGRLGHWERLAVASGMNARGAMEIIVATVGLSLGILSREMYSIIVMVAIVTSLMAPPLLRWTLGRVPARDQERERLDREKIAEVSFVRGIRRVLVPTRGGSNSRVAASLVGGLATAQPLEATVLRVSPQGGPPPVQDEVASALGEAGASNVRSRLVKAEEPGRAILREARRGYDLLVLGAPAKDAAGASFPFSGLVDQLIHQSPCPVLVVREGRAEREDAEGLQILVPTSGAPQCIRALEMASAIVARDRGTVTLLHVVPPPVGEYLMVEPRREEQTRDLVERQASYCRRLGAETKVRVRTGASSEEEVLRLAVTESFDLILVGADLRPVTDGIFFGHGVSRLLAEAECAVAVISAPRSGVVELMGEEEETPLLVQP